MEWYSWLSMTGLEPALVYEYGLVFAHNELEEEDVVHFDHEFLQSMGISIAKHRLEILKLAARERRRRRRREEPVTRLLAAVGKTRRCLSRYIRSLAHGSGGREGQDSASSALVVVPRKDPSYGAAASSAVARWRGGMQQLKRERSPLVLVKQGRLLLTDGSGVKSGTAVPPPSRSNSASPMITYREEMRWDSMFQDLKPT